MHVYYLQYFYMLKHINFFMLMSITIWKSIIYLHIEPFINIAMFVVLILLRVQANILILVYYRQTFKFFNI
jgi:hypothetical protein